MEYITSLHALAGVLVAITGILQIILPKGGTRHRLLGRFYFGAWIIIVVTGGLIGSALITLFGILGFYMAYTGIRLARLKSTKLALIDKIIIGIALACSIGTLGWGVKLLIQNVITFGIIACVFGGIFLLTAVKDYRMFISSRVKHKMSDHPMHWYFEHFTRMYVSFIAAMTAFIVIQNVFGIALLNWLLPTVLGTLLIIYTNRYYRKKLKLVI